MTRRFDIFGNNGKPADGLPPPSKDKNPPRIPSADEVILARNQEQFRTQVTGAQTRMWCVQQATGVAEKSPMSADDLIKLTEFFYKFVVSAVDGPKTDKV